MSYLNTFRKWTGNSHFARTLMDKILVSVFIFGAHLALWYEFYLVVPYYYPDDTPLIVFVHYLVAAVIYINTFGNLYYMISTSATKSFAEIRAYHRPDWHYCVACQGYFPPRSHHCKICDVCVLKRDHHCWFGGTCVGYHNHRYFIVMILYIWLAAVYANILHFSFMTAQLGGFGPGVWLCLFLPHMALLFGFLSLYQFLVAFLSFIALLCLVMFTWMFLIQIVQLRHGQTKYEKKKNIVEFDCSGWKENAREVFGEKWYLVWLHPWVKSSLRGDGVNFRRDTKAR